MSSKAEPEMSFQDRIIAGLQDPSAYPHAVERVAHIETHISRVLLAGDYAYKLKKPLNLGFLDFSTLQRRRLCCEEEIRLNRRLAPSIYLEVVTITGTPDQPRVGGKGAVLEYAVKMRRFDQHALLTRLPVTRSLVDRIAARVAGFHAVVPVAPMSSEYGTPETVLLPMVENFAQIRGHLRDPEALARLQLLERWTRGRHYALRPVLQQRRVKGHIRECHGDMHRGNIALVNGEPLIFDCIEFSPALRWIDTMSELAFLVMDLEETSENPRARQLVNSYLEISGDFDGLPVLDFYKAYRAMVRAKVTAIRLDQPDLEPAKVAGARDDYDRYVALAQSYAEERPKRLILTHGVSGTGKSRLAMFLREHLPLIHIRSDLERKRLFGLPAETRTASGKNNGIYASAASERTYVRLRELAALILEAGYSPLVDATFLKASRRAPFLDLAAQQDCPCIILDLTAPECVLRERVRVRQASGLDPSEAGVAVLEVQLDSREPLSEAERALALSIDTHRPPEPDKLLGMIDRYPMR